MNFLRQFIEAMLNLLNAKSRSILAILGILVGTGSVVALLTTSQLAATHALAQFKILGTNLVAVSILSQNQSSKGEGAKSQLTLEDVNLLKKNISKLETVAPYILTYQAIHYHGKQYQGSVIGAYNEFGTVAKLNIAEGRFVSLLDQSSFYAVIGSKLAQNLKNQGMTNLIGTQIRLGGWYFTIVGVLQPWQPNFFVYIDMNDSVLVPIETAHYLSGYTAINNLLIKLKPATNLPETQIKIKNTLNKFLPTAKINIRNPQEIINLMSKQQATYTWLLGAIGGISLLVGGIGVMNIMLVSVIERRPEIGIRLTIGARQGDILWMFLIESVVLTVFGGILGIVIGLVVSYGIARFSDWEFFFYPLPPLLGFLVCVFVGIISGFYPALRASRVDPIGSLRGK